MAKIKRSASIAGALKERENVRAAKSMLKSLNLSDLEKIENVVQTVRNLFPRIDELLLPSEVFKAAGLPKDLMGNIFANDGCQNCHATCQKCYTCQKCDLCYTCQKEFAGMRPIDLYSREDIIRYQLIQVIQSLSSKAV